MKTTDLILGIDGGGSKTVAWLAPADSTHLGPPLGHGRSGAANPQSIGWETAKGNLGAAIDAAFQNAGLEPVEVSAACVAMAGGDRKNDQLEVANWASRRRLTRRLRVVNDAMPVLAAGTPHSVGVSLIAGTGSLAFARDASGATARAGGWGYLFGDEGSGYAIALAALRQIAQSLDGRRGPTLLTNLFCEALQVTEPGGLIPAIYTRRADRTWIASLAPMVVAAAQRCDTAACRILSEAADELAAMVNAVVRALDLPRDELPLALSGGLLVHSALLRDHLKHALQELEILSQTIRVVAEPVAGAVLLARAEFHWSSGAEGR